jgi:chemotaxis protein MotB
MAKHKCPPPGAPAWMTTFADLMSLLMCFFVLLLSFSEMDVIKYKQVAGSMKDAFGVQREIKVKEPPKGINIIAREFSPGVPKPTPHNVVQQETTRTMLENPDLGESRHKKDADGEGKAKYMYRELRELKDFVEANMQGAERAEALERIEKLIDLQQGMVDAELKQEAFEQMKQAEAAEKAKLTQADAERIRDALRKEIRDGAVDVETQGLKILIRIRERASFASGSADLRSDFAPILGGIAGILRDTEGRIVVAGHTDDIPIHNFRFRSNWELSASRAVTVAHALQDSANIPADRFQVEGHAETQPVAPNDSDENRGRNRRVEIIIEQGNDLEENGPMSDAPGQPGGRAAGG